MGRAIVLLSGLGMFVFGLASYVPGIPLPVNCKSTVCEVGTAIISLDMVLMGVGILLVLLAMGLSKRAT